MDFDDFDQADPFGSGTRKPQKQTVAGGWHWLLTLLSLGLVGGLSFLMAFLTKDVQERPVWMMGLIFAVPAGAMFFSAMLLEFTTGAMTPAVSRISQVRVAAAATLATFLVACLCDGVYLLGGFVGDSSDNLIFLDYERKITGNSPTDQALMKVLDDLYLKAGKRVETALFMFSTEQEDTDQHSVIPLKPFTKEHLEKMREALIEGKKNTSSVYGHQRAYEMVENSENGKPTRIVIICDGSLIYGNETYTKEDWDRDLERLKKDQIKLYFMGNGTPDEGMLYMTEHSGGATVMGYGTESVLENLQTFVHADGDMVRAETVSAKALCGAMLGLEGSVIGLGLMLLLSVHGQKRFQAVLSPILGILAFLLLKILPRPEGIPQWILEGIAFSLFGLVFMRRNNTGAGKGSGGKTAAIKTAGVSADDW